MLFRTGPAGKRPEIILLPVYPAVFLHEMQHAQMQEQIDFPPALKNRLASTAQAPGWLPAGNRSRRSGFSRECGDSQNPSRLKPLLRRPGEVPEANCGEFLILPACHLFLAEMEQSMSFAGPFRLPLQPTF